MPISNSHNPTPILIYSTFYYNIALLTCALTNLIPNQTLHWRDTNPPHNNLELTPTNAQIPNHKNSSNQTSNPRQITTPWETRSTTQKLKPQTITGTQLFPIHLTPPQKLQKLPNTKKLNKSSTKLQKTSKNSQVVQKSLKNLGKGGGDNAGKDPHRN
jgi:hypothetical protein